MEEITFEEFKSLLEVRLETVGNMLEVLGLPFTEVFQTFWDIREDNYTEYLKDWFEANKDQLDVRGLVDEHY